MNQKNIADNRKLFIFIYTTYISNAKVKWTCTVCGAAYYSWFSSWLTLFYNQQIKDTKKQHNNLTPRSMESVQTMLTGLTSWPN